MFQLQYEEIISRIKEEKQLSDEEIEVKIKQKLTQLSDLISREGAAHIVANELGVKVLSVPKDMKINRLLSGMTNISLLGKVVKLNEVVNFNKNGREGKVVSFLFGDETGVVRAVFWDVNHINQIEDGSIKEGSIIKLTNGYVKSNNGYKEVHLGNKGAVEIQPNGAAIEVNQSQSFDFDKKKIADLKAGEISVGVIGTIVQVFEPRFYEACPNCGKKLDGDTGKCLVHGEVSKESVPIVNVFIDDGSDNIRAVAFRNQAETLLNIGKEQLLELKDHPENFETIRNELLGRQLMLVGRVTRNEMFERNEMMIQKIMEVDPDQLINELEKSA